MKINSIQRVPFTGKVYNLELKSNSQQDDLFWLEGTSGVITHNCFPKDLQAMRFVASQLEVSTPVLDGTLKTNNRVRTNKDWEGQEGRAIIHKQSV